MCKGKAPLPVDEQAHGQFPLAAETSVLVQRQFEAPPTKLARKQAYRVTMRVIEAQLTQTG